MSRFLIVTWDGAGNLLPTLGIAQRLSDAGHDVRLLGHPSIDERCGNSGWTFRPFSTVAPYDSAHPGDLAEEMPFIVSNVFFGAATAHDTIAEFEREAAEVLLVDALLAAAMCAAEALPAASAVLYHTSYGLFRGGPLLEMISPAMPLLEPLRRELGLDPVGTLPELHDRADLSLVASPREFEPPGETGPRVHFVGPILDGPALAGTEIQPSPSEGPDPLVLVSFSTSDMAQTSIVQRVIDALAGLPVQVLVTAGPAVERTRLVAARNTNIVSYLPHSVVLPRASLVVTHAGLGTVMAALAHGVPLIALPMGRDQFFNAGRIAELGVGSCLPLDSAPELIAKTVASVLDDPALRRAADEMAATIAGYGGSAAAVAALEQLAKA